jgi:hypothetical protein
LLCADPAEFLKYNFNIKEGAIQIQWMAGAQTNICYNALGRGQRYRYTLFSGKLSFAGGGAIWGENQSEKRQRQKGRKGKSKGKIELKGAKVTAK